MKRSSGATSSTAALDKLGLLNSNEDARAIAFVLVGGSSSYALKRVIPAIFRLFCSSLISTKFLLFGVGGAHDTESYRQAVEHHLGPGDKDTFLRHCFFVQGEVSNWETGDRLKKRLSGISRIVVYFADRNFLTCECIQVYSDSLATQTDDGYLRCVVEKYRPLQLKDVVKLDQFLVSNFKGEKNVYRLDHFVAKEMVQNILTMRFANRFLEPSWNNHHIQAVTISCREVETISNSEFDGIGIIRDIIVDHLLNIMSLLAMETPVSLDDADCIRDECTKVLRSIRPVKDLVLGQYSGYNKEGSTTPTFASCVLYIDNPRWYGVPFILKAGKGMYEKRTDIRIQFKKPHNNLFTPLQGAGPLNELIIRVQPNADIYMKILRKDSGMGLSIVQTKLDIFSRGGDVTDSFVNSYVPDSYESLVHDVIAGDKTKFMRNDELEYQWKIFDSILELSKHFTLIQYPIGSRGPKEYYDMLQKVGFVSQHKLQSEKLGPKSISRMQKLINSFSISIYQMEEIIQSFRREMLRGLAGEPSSIAMLPTYVCSIPKYSEKGVYYALDLGGTNFRVSRFVFDGRGGIEQTEERKFTVPDDAMTGDSVQLFDFLAKCISTVSVDEPRKYGFTFSFPAQQDALNSGRLLLWTKNFTATGVVGEDVVDLLKQAMDRIGFQGDIMALVNDTTGTLVSGAFDDPQTMIGIILGTGTNGAYREKVENIRKLPSEVTSLGGEMLINMEWGNFGSTIPILPSTDIDRAIDEYSRNKGRAIFEKMISGLYLGEICRLCCLELYEVGELWQEAQVNSVLIRTPYSFDTRLLSSIEYDMSVELKIVERTLSQYGVAGSSIKDRLMMKEICGMIIQRAARLTACAIASTVAQINPTSDCTVCFDGSVYEHHPSFRQRLLQALGEVNCDVNLSSAKDGSGKGAALIACGASPCYIYRYFKKVI